MTPLVFSDRTARLEDARAASSEACERQLVTAQAAAEFRVTDFLAAGFAEAHRRWQAADPTERIAARFKAMTQTPEQYGADLGPQFLDILKDVSAVRAPAQAPEVIELLPTDKPHSNFLEFHRWLTQDLARGLSL